MADNHSGDFDVVLVRKLRTPEQPDLAMGAVDEAGRVYHFAAKAAVRSDLYAEEVAEQVAEIQRRRRLARPPTLTHQPAMQISPNTHR